MNRNGRTRAGFPCRQVGGDIIKGKGHPGPSPGPVTPK